MRPAHLLSRKRACLLRESLRDTKSAPVNGPAQRQARTRIIGTPCARTARIVLAYHEENERLRAELRRSGAHS